MSLEEVWGVPGKGDLNSGGVGFLTDITETNLCTHQLEAQIETHLQENVGYQEKQCLGLGF